MIPKITAILVLFASPAFSEQNLENSRSADILAEIEYLASLVPPPKRLTGTDRQAFEDFLTSKSICDGLGYEDYEAYAIVIASEFPDAQRMHIGERSYRLRSEKGCDFDMQASAIVENYLGDVDRRALVLRAIEVRHKEMMRRTLQTD